MHSFTCIHGAVKTLSDFYTNIYVYVYVLKLNFSLGFEEVAKK